MNEMYGKVEKIVREQQAKLKEGEPAWCVGEQLLDMARGIPGAAELLAQDLTVEGMGIKYAEKKLKAFADERHRKIGGSCVGILPREAEKILREFYGIHGEAVPEPVVEVRAAADPMMDAPDALDELDIDSLL